MQGAQGSQGNQGAQGSQGAQSITGDYPAAGLGYQTWAFDPAEITSTIVEASTTPSFESVYLSAGQTISHITFDTTASGSGTSYVALYTATNYLTFTPFTAAVGVNTVALSYTVTSSGFYWIAIQTGATLYAAAPTTAPVNIGYTPAANTLSGSRAVTVSGQSLNTAISGTPVVMTKIPWFALS